ncbi:MAG: hypothetical protein WKG07_49915 [Hymenobacter sp.]
MDSALAILLRTRFRLGMFDGPGATPTISWNPAWSTAPRTGPWPARWP